MPGHSRGGTKGGTLPGSGKLDFRVGSLEPSQIRKQGWLEKQASRKLGRALQRRFCEAYRGAFVYYKTSGADRKTRATILLSSWSTVAQDVYKAKIFYLTPNPSTRVYQFVAETEAECKEWVDVIRLGCVDEAPTQSLTPPPGEPFFKDDGPTIGIFVKAFLRCEEHQCVVVTTTLFPRSPVRDLMRIIRDTPSLAFPIAEQSLMFDRIVLEPHHTLEYYNIKADDVIVVIHNTPIIQDSTSVSEILTHLGTNKLVLPDRTVGCVAWSDRKQEHYHIYWSKNMWASRAQPTLSAEQKKEIRASGSKSILAQSLADMAGSPTGTTDKRTYLSTKRDSLPAPPTLSLSLSSPHSRSPSLVGQTSMPNRANSPPPTLNPLPPNTLTSSLSASSSHNRSPLLLSQTSLSRASSPSSLSFMSPGTNSTVPLHSSLIMGSLSNHNRSSSSNVDVHQSGGNSSSNCSTCNSCGNISLGNSEDLSSPSQSPPSVPSSPNSQSATLQGKLYGDTRRAYDPAPLEGRKRSSASSEPRRASDPPKGEKEGRTLGKVSTCTLPMPPQEGITWKRGKILGKGAWGTVYEALNIQSGALMAVKQVNIKLDDAEKQSQAQALEREIAMMTVLSHPNIVKIIGSEIKDDKINILMEYVPGASLSTQLKQFGPFTEEHAKKYARQLVEALAYCHAAGVVHRDIKGANVLVTLSGNPKLADFGSAKKLSDIEQKESLSEDFNYTTEWTAPEVFSQGEFNSKVDIWSLGCVIIEMITARTPWAEHKFNNREQAMFFIGSHNSVPAIPQKLSAEGQDFLLCCLNRDPLERASAKELLNHPWIAHLSIDRQYETQSLEPRPMGSFSPLAGQPKPFVPSEVAVPSSEPDRSDFPSNPETAS